MPVTTSYPGIYIEELPSSTHTITPAPTSIAVFIGYTHPYKTLKFWQPVQIFSFADYVRAFGGLYHNAWLDSNVAYAVQQFFLNGGSQAYVYGLQSANFSSWTPPAAATATSPATPPSGGPTVTLTTSGTGAIVFAGLEPVDPAHPMYVQVRLPPGQTSSSTADVIVQYGAPFGATAVDFSATETFRNVSLTPGAPNFIETVINGNSDYLWVSPGSAGYGTTFTAAGPAQLTVANAPTVAPFVASDFTGPTEQGAIGPFVTDGPLDKVPVFNLMVLPGVTDDGVWAQAIAFCERRRAFLIMDPPPNFNSDNITGGLNQITTVGPGPAATSTPISASINSAIYFPYLATIDSLSGDPIRLPPSGYVAGVYATTDANRGVWKAPAGLAATINNATGVVPEGALTDNLAGVLNNNAIDAIRTFPGVGTVVFGARTSTATNTALQQWLYVPVRRMALFIEQTLYANLGWAVFEPNDTPLWTALRTTVEAFMLTLFNQGAFQGSTPSQAFQVVCDSTTTTQTDIDNGIVNILVAFAPLKPAEFVVIQIAQLAGQAQSS